MTTVDQQSPSELPLVTVITPVYNGERYLEGVIQSVQEQDYPNVEHIVLDDGSSDGTLEVIKRHGDRLRWDSHENMGEARTVNKGFSMAKGEILGVVNSDDPLLPGAISTMVEHLLARPEVLVAYPDWLLIDGEGNITEHIKTYDYDYVEMLRRHHCMPGPGAFFRRKLVEEIGGRDPGFRYANDFDFWLRAGLVGEFMRVPETLATFRHHPAARSSSDLGLEMAEEPLRMTGKVYATPDLPLEVRKAKREAYSSAYYIAGVLCGGDSWSAVKRRYFIRALRLAPSKYFRKYLGRWAVISPALLGPLFPPLRRPIKFAYRASKQVTGRMPHKP